MQILIAGAGVGGLTAALCLQQAGHEVSVFEQAPEFAEVGAGLQCGANALKVLEHLGLMPAIQALAVEPQQIKFLDYRSAKALYTVDLGAAYAQKYGAPYYHLHRADLHGVLADVFQQRTSGQLHLNATVAAYTESDNGVEIELIDGRRFSGDCLIGADGLRSIIRKQMLGKIKPEFTRNVAWRAVVDTDRLPVDWMDTIASNFVGPNKHVVLYYLRQQKLANLVGVVENSKWTDDSWVTTAPWEELKADFAGWHPTVQTIIDAVDKDQCYRWALYQHKPFSNWSTPRVTLLGDAAHATLPFMASGAALAIEDGRVLQRALEQAASVGEALQLYQHNRMQRTARVQSMSANFGKLYHIRNRALLKVAFATLKVFSGKGEAFLPEYNANTVKLT